MTNSLSGISLWTQRCFATGEEKYVVWAEKVNKGKKISNLYIARLETPWKLATAQVLLASPDYDWEPGGLLGQ